MKDAEICDTAGGRDDRPSLKPDKSSCLDGQTPQPAPLSSRESKEWFPSKLLTTEKPEHPFAVIVLNQPLSRSAYHLLAQKSSLVVCADGGANWLFDLIDWNNSDTSMRVRASAPQSHSCLENIIDAFLDEQHLPNAVVGDLDSVRKEVEQVFRIHNVEIVQDPDQYSTDFTKCLKWLRKEANIATGREHLDVVALGGLGGRVDQGMSQLHHLFMAVKNTELLNGDIYLWSEQSLSFILDRGRNKINIEPNSFGQNVGIIPIGVPAIITTKGLEWDVQDWKTEFGGQISTSNHLKDEVVEVKTNERVLFTLELAGTLSE